MILMQHFVIKGNLYDYQPLISNTALIENIENVENTESNEVSEQDNSTYDDEGEMNKNSINDNDYPVLLLYIFLTSTSICDLINSVLIGFDNDYSSNILIKLLFYKVLISFTFGTLLIETSTTENIQIFFMFLFAISTSIGILMGCIFFNYAIYLSWSYIAINNILLIISKLLSIITAGQMIHVTTLKMLPTNLNLMNRVKVNENIHNSQFYYKTCNILCLLVGYLFAIIPCYF
jgi:hypothetical protein